MHITVSLDKTKKQSKLFFFYSKNGCCSWHTSTKIRAALTLYRTYISKQKTILMEYNENRFALTCVRSITKRKNKYSKRE